jgi:hypothetical protein
MRESARSAVGPFETCQGGLMVSVVRGIVLQKSKVAALKIFREKTKQRAIADLYGLNRATEVACEFCERP